MATKKIVFVCNHLAGGGAERVLTTLANHCAQMGHLVSILALDATNRYPLHPSVNVLQIPATQSFFRRAVTLRKLLGNMKPDVVISFEYYVNLITSLACLGKQCKIILSERADPVTTGSGLLKTPLRNFLYRFCDTLVCQTAQIKEYFPRYIQVKTALIANPLTTELPLAHAGPRNKEIVNFCRLNTCKNLPLLLRAFALFHTSHADYTLHIFGNGPLKEDLERLIQQSGLDLYIFLHPAQKDIHTRVLKSAMFVSSSDMEGLSNSMLEAMALGLPTICTDCAGGGAKMIIKNEENGLLVPRGDVQSLARAMTRLADNPAFAERLAANAVKLRQELDINNIAAKWEKYF